MNSRSLATVCRARQTGLRISELSIVAGGLVAAVTSPLELEHGSWAAAYLVLVGGVAQNAMNRAPDALGYPSTSVARDWSIVASWNVGNAAVLAGTFLETPWIVTAGAVPLVGGLVLAWSATTGDAHPDPAPAARAPRRRALRTAYQLGLAALAVSLPIGVVLSQMRHG